MLSVFLILLGLRYQGYLRFYQEVQFVKSFWAETMKEDVPTDNWKSKLSDTAKSRGDSLFYGLKVWFIDFGPAPPSPHFLSFEDAGYISFWPRDSSTVTSNIAVVFKYTGTSQRLHATVFQTGNVRTLFPSLSLDNCSWSPDHNGDGKVDKADVVLAQKAKQP